MPFTRQWNLNSIISYKKKANIFLKTFEFDFFDSKSSLILTAIKNIWITFFTANTFSFIHVVDSLFFKCYISFLFLIHCWNVFSFSFLPFTFFFFKFRNSVRELYQEMSEFAILTNKKQKTLKRHSD